MISRAARERNFKMKKAAPLPFLFALFALSVLTADFLSAQESAGSPLPENWLSEWKNPTARMRPMQIVHGADLTDPAKAAYYRDDCGLGGLVINVGGNDYIRNQENWDRFVQGAKNAADAGLRLWIYDEQGYPSLEAGGVVLEGRPELVSKELVWDKDAPEPFTVRDCYEFTHSCNSYSTARRYPNPLNPAAVERFIEVTHARYKKELGDELYNKIESFFTDEPSMMAANLGQIPEDVRKRIKIDDPIDPDKKNLPMLPWCDDLEAQYKARYGEELRPHFLSLFTGQTDADKKIRANYWKLIEDLYAERFYGAIQKFCRDNGGPVSSGHTLHEEILNGHVPLDGNKMRTVKAFDIPGLDLLNSDAFACQHGAWLAAAFPCSAARLNGQRRTMSEVSDFGQIMGGEKKSVPLDWMEATAAWQAAWGVTDFMLYYGIHGTSNAPYRNEESHKKYSEFVGRLNAVLLDAEPVRPLLLYYPIETMQREFCPTKERVNDFPQSETMNAATSSFVGIGRALMRAQIPFTVIDGDSILELADERLAAYTGILFPRESNPPQNVRDRLEKVWQISAAEKESAGGAARFMTAGAEDPCDTPEAVAESFAASAGPRLAISPASDHLTEGVFARDGRLIFLTANLYGDAYSGTVSMTTPEFGPFAGKKYSSEGWAVMDPQTGEVKPLAVSLNDGKITFPLELTERESLLVVSPKAE